MNWQYRVVRADTAENFEAALNQAGGEGWEAIFGGYSIGEAKKVSLGQGMPASMAIGASVWAAIMKRQLKA